MVTNASAQASSGSASEALEAIDSALAKCERAAAGLKERGKEHLPAYRTLRDRIEGLRHKRRALADVAQR